MGGEERDAVEQFVAHLREQRRPSGAETDAVRRLLRMWLSRRRLDPDELGSVTNDAILRLMRAVEGEGLDPARPPGAWLRVVADHLALDAIRRRSSLRMTDIDEILSTGAAEDEYVARLLDAAAAASDIDRALRAAADDGRDEIVRIISAWLGLAAANGEEPSLRELGDRLGLNHMRVQRALTVFKSYLAPDRVPPSHPRS